MTVQELIEELQKHPGDMQVLVDGYEYGFDPVKDVGVMNLVDNPSDWTFEGQYLTAEDREGQINSKYDPIPERDDEGQRYMEHLVIKANRGANAQE